MIQVAYDPNGYSYRIDTGDLVNIEYDFEGNAFEVGSGEEIQFVRIDAPSTTNGNPIYTDITSATKDVLIAIFGNSNQPYSGPRIPVGQIPPTSPIITTPRSMIGVGVGANASPGGIGGSLNISTNTLLLGGVVLAAFFFGKRGR